jgi:hypothetical protein
VWNAPLGPADTFNNSGATGSYSNFQFSQPIRGIYRDSTYNARVVDITQYSWVPGSDTRIFIDYNRDGIFQTNEVALSGPNALSGGISNLCSGQFTVPSWASPGITGLRVISNTNGSAANIDPCDPYWAGETEDYLVEILLPTCSSPISAGAVWISDTVTCPGYDIVLIDTTHTSFSQYLGLTGGWQRSVNAGATWTNIPAATSDTLVVNPNVTTYYRYRIICSNGDTAYSNIVHVQTLSSNACYPASGAQWGSNDTADNGAFGIGTVLFTAGGGGPHVGNPAATRARTDFSANPAFLIDLWTDSTYNINFYNILKPYNHADAKITMFIDYNNDGVYSPATERVFSGLSTANNFVTAGTFVTPLTPVLNTPTGLRIVLNNNTAPNPASDNGVGLYVSGETEDYSVRFRKTPVYPAGTADPIDFTNVSVYPNPTGGMLFIDVVATQIEQMNVVVTTITGQEVFRAQHKDIAGKFSTSIDLSNLRAGNYMLKLQSEKGSVVRSIILQ